MLIQPYDVRLLVIRAEPDGIDDSRTIRAVEATLKRPLTDYERTKFFASAGEQAITVTLSDCVCVRFINPDHEDPSVVAVHEAFHVTASILRFARVKFSAASEEAWAYLVEYIFKKLRGDTDA